MYLSVNTRHDSSYYIPQPLQWQVLDEVLVAILLRRVRCAILGQNGIVVSSKSLDDKGAMKEAAEFL